MSVVESPSPHLRDFLRIKDDGVAGRRPEPVGFAATPLHSGAVSSPLHSGAVSSPQQPSRTLLDIIRDEEPSVGPSYKRLAEHGAHHGKDKRSWKSFKDRLKLRRAGPTSPSPSSDFHTNNKALRSPDSRQGSSRFDSPGLVPSGGLTQPVNSVEARNDEACGSSRRSTRFGALVPISIEPARSGDSSERSPGRQISRRNSARYESQITEPSPTRALVRSESSPVSRERSNPAVREPEAATPAQEPPRQSTRRLSVVLAEERELSAREAAAAQEAATAAEEEPVRMSLMDLLEETDRQMGLEGPRYTVGDDDHVGDGVSEEAAAATGGGGGAEMNCCICMVRHKGAAFIPCGHTFCRLCSRELWVNRGSCPLCNNYIVEILDIF